MLGSLLSPLAPAASLLLSAFILFGVIPLLPANQRERWSIGAPVLVGISLVTVLFIPITAGNDILGDGLDLLSGWNFSTTESVAALTVRADLLSLPFLIVTFLVLLAVTLLCTDLQDAAAPAVLPVRVLGWLLMGAAACLLFVAANGLTALYMVVAFDGVTAVYWITKKQRDVAVSRLFLGVFIGAALMLSTLLPAAHAAWGQHALGIALWLRLGLYPMVEVSVNRNWRDDERLAYLALTLIVGFYLTARMVQQPFSGGTMWLLVLTMLFGGLAAWLTDNQPGQLNGPEAEPAAVTTRRARTRLVTWLGLTLALLPLLAAPLSLEAATAFAVGLTLSLVALWVTPALGRPSLAEGAWSWPYLPAALATITVVGVPFSLGWTFRGLSYQSVFQIDSLPVLLVVVLAEALALSGLLFYWRWLVQAQEQNLRRSVVGILAVVPFLMPGLGPFILFSLTTSEQPFPYAGGPAPILITMAGTVLLAAGLGYFKPRLRQGLKLPPPAVVTGYVRGSQLLHWGDVAFFQISKVILRVQLVFEGQHYMGWAMFFALVGTIIILLS